MELKVIKLINNLWVKEAQVVNIGYLK